MKPADKKRGPPPTGTRTGPRARAAHERQFSDPYQRASRPSRAAGEGGERPAGRNAVVTLEPDVARAFRTSEAVNEALRLVLRLARFASRARRSTAIGPVGPGPFRRAAQVPTTRPGARCAAR
jgi:hypothetical protein